MIAANRSFQIKNPCRLCRDSLFETDEKTKDRQRIEKNSYSDMKIQEYPAIITGNESFDRIKYGDRYSGFGI